MTNSCCTHSAAAGNAPSVSDFVLQLYSSPERQNLLAAPRPPFLPEHRADALRVLSVGEERSGGLVLDALANQHDFSITFAKDFQELWVVPRAVPIQTCVLHPSLGSFELEEVCRMIRRRWPSASIVVIRDGENMLEDALFDERLHPPVAPELLHSIVLRMSAAQLDRRTRDARR